MTKSHEKLSVDFFAVAVLESSGADLFEGATDRLVCYFLLGSLRAFLQSQERQLPDVPSDWLSDLNSRLVETQQLFEKEKKSLQDYKDHFEKIEAEAAAHSAAGNSLSNFVVSDGRPYFAAYKNLFWMQQEIGAKIERLRFAVQAMSSLKTHFESPKLLPLISGKAKNNDVEFDFDRFDGFLWFQRHLSESNNLNSRKSFVVPLVDQCSQKGLILPEMSERLRSWAVQVIEGDWSDPVKIADTFRGIEARFKGKQPDPIDLFEATLFDFTIDKIAGVMRSIPLPQDWKHLTDPARLNAFLDDALDLRESLHEFCEDLNAEGRAMQGAMTARNNANRVLQELEKAEEFRSLRVGKLMELGQILEGIVADEDVQKEFGALSTQFKINVEKLRALIRSHFAHTLARTDILREIRMEADANPWEVLKTFRDIVAEALSAQRSGLIPMSPEDAALLGDILDSVETKLRALEATPSEGSQASLKREVDFQIAKVGATVGVYADRAKNAVEPTKAKKKKLGDDIDDVLKWEKRTTGIWKLGRAIYKFLTGEGG